LIYRESARVYRFDVAREGNTWLVSLPPTGARFEPVVLTDSELAIILPRIENLLSRAWWFGVWPVRYKVVFQGPSTARDAVSKAPA
jgi:hypothetical protein